MKKMNKQMITFSYQGLFRNYGSCLLQYFKPHVERLMADTSHDKHDSSQRCAMEIMAGALRGSKHWSYSEVCFGRMGQCWGLSLEGLMAPTSHDKHYI